MTEKELKRLGRSELLELLLIQTKETERLTERLEKAEKMLADRNLRVEKAGDLARAVLEVNGVMEAAQAAAKQYLDNIEKMEQETKRRCEKMLGDAQKKAARILQEAEKTGKAGKTGKAEKPPVSDQDLIGEIYALLGEKH